MNRYNGKLEKVRCSRCSWDKIPKALHVHHIDRDRKNHSLENLEVLCANCHQEEHWKESVTRMKNLSKKGKILRYESPSDEEYLLKQLISEMGLKRDRERMKQIILILNSRTKIIKKLIIK